MFNPRNSLYFIWTSLLSIIICTYSCNSADPPARKGLQNGIIQVEYPEVYELANIILALTEYGLTDDWQVQKDIAYYDEMIEYFKPYMDHPLLDSANYSQSRWKEYLSFRTDSYAFIFDEENQLSRTNDFRSFDIQPFDDHLDLVQDFAEKTDYRTFYNEHLPYYQEIIGRYQEEYMLHEMKGFLEKEFDDYFSNQRYSIVISPFVYAQQLHRQIDSNWAADFPNVAKAVIENIPFESAEEKSTELHVLFTEMDHGYVNPTTDQYFESTKFDTAVWDNNSGYGGRPSDVFNEYMTWAVFDLFNNRYFPEIAGQTNLRWHFQNETRGFPYSHLFARELERQHTAGKGKTKISDLFPDLLQWTDSIQNKLSKPNLLNNGDTLIVSKETTRIILAFSEPMQKTSEFDIIVQHDRWNSEVMTIGEASNLQWSEDGKEASFEVNLPVDGGYYVLLNWWGVSKPIIGATGVLLKAYSGLVVPRV